MQYYTSSEGLRLADYADEVERLETIATRIATALGARVELARLNSGKNAELEVPVRGLLTGDQDNRDSVRQLRAGL
jgi:hypothetical protein